MEKQCERCKRAFRTRSKRDAEIQRFCSRECWGASRIKWRTCQQCGGSYKRGAGDTRRGTKFCSQQCYDDHRHTSEQEQAARRREYRRQYYLKNREKVLARIQAQREADPEVFKQQRAEQARKRREANPEKHRESARRRHIKVKYGITLEEYDEILARGCAICGTHEGRVVGKRNKHEPPPRRLCLDHDHSNGKIRDALCHNCNSALGLCADDPARLRAAADYLESHRTT